MYASRVPVKVLNVLSKLGLCQSYNSITRQIVHLSQDAREVIRELVRDDSNPVGGLYDNINYMVNTKHQDAEQTNQFTSAVVGNAFNFDAEVSLPSPTHPQVPEAIFHKVISETMSPPTSRSRKVCPSATLLKRSMQPSGRASQVPLALKDVLPDAY
jgi:hypothetical protein